MAKINPQTASRFPIVLAIMVLAGSGSIMSTDLYAPSLPYLTEFFGSTPELIKLTISMNLIVYGFAQLLYGPVSDRFGRRPVFLWSIAFFALASIGCAIAKSADQLLIARILQGFFAAAEPVICLAVFKDLFTEKEQVKGFAIYGMSIALAPAVAPVLGGYIHIYFGWEYNFYLTAAVGVFTAFLIYALLPESATPDSNALRVKHIVSNYLQVLRNRLFMVFSILAGLSLGFVYVFTTGAPFILIDYFGLPLQYFGYYQAVIVVAFFFGSMLATRLVDRWDPIHVLALGITSCTLGAAILSLLIFTELLTTYRFGAAYCLIAFGMGPMFAVSPSKALGAVKKSAGSAAALFGSIEMGLSGILAAVISVFHDDTPHTFGVVIALIALAVLLLGWLGARLARSPSENAQTQTL